MTTTVTFTCYAERCEGRWVAKVNSPRFSTVRVFRTLWFAERWIKREVRRRRRLEFG